MHDENVRAVIERVNANELEAETIARFAALTRHGYKYVDLKVRVNGQTYDLQAEWLVRLFRPKNHGG